MILFCGLIGVEAIACQIIIANIYYTSFSMPIGMMTAASSCIGKQIGSGDVAKARQYYAAYKHLSFFFILTCFIILYFSWNPLFSLFTTSEDILKIGRSIRLLICIVMVFDHWQGV